MSDIILAFVCISTISVFYHAMV